MKPLLRILRRDPRTSIPVLLLLALGAGGFAWLLGLRRSVLLRSLPAPEPGRLVALWNGMKGRPGHGTPSYGELELMRRETGSFSGVAAYFPVRANYGEAGQAELLKVDRVTANAFQVLGVKPALGRGFSAQDEVPGQERSALVTDAFWRSRLGADPAVLGRSIRLDGLDYQVAGVLPAGFRTPWGSQVFTPLAVTPAQRQDLGAHYLRVFARLRDGVGLAQAQAAMAVASERFIQSRPDLFTSAEDKDYTFGAGYLLDESLGDGVKVMAALEVAAALVLLLAALNASALMLARVQGRRRELALRCALGAPPARLRLNLLGEGALLGLLGGALGLLLAAVALGAASRLLQLGFAELDLSGLHLDGATVAAALAFGPALGLLCALAARPPQDPALVLKEGGRGQVGGSRRLRQRLVLGQLALATALLGSAAWLHGGVSELFKEDLGLRPRGVWTFRLSPTRELLQDPARLEGLASELGSRLSQLPGVRAAGVLNNAPMSGFRSDLGMSVDGRPFDPEARCATPGALEALGLRLLRGRGIAAEDRADGQQVILLSRSLAQACFPGQDPLGRRVDFDVPRTVVGVFEDFREFGPAQAAPQLAFLPYAQGGALWNRTLHAAFRVDGPAPSEREIQALARAAAPGLALSHYAPLDANLAELLGPQRMARAFLAAFAALALALAAGGVYGLMAASVAERQGEFGVRSALGATAKDLLSLVLGESAKLALGGALLGLLLALGLRLAGGAWVAGLPFSGPAAPFAAAGLLLAAALGSTLPPALRAARIDPMEALRSE